MLNVYPIQATAENWLHDVLSEKIVAAVSAMNVGAVPIGWGEGLRAELQGRPALAARYDAFCVAARALTNAQREELLQVLTDQNNIPAVFDGQTACPSLLALPESIRKPTRDLFDVAFDSLKALGIRDRQYALIYGQLPGKCCPFCGIEPFEAPGLAREDLDHYLPISRYTFAGANLRNLAPMGGKCNASYKLAQDVLCDEDGNRRRCFDPYGAERVDVSLLHSRPFEGEIRDFFPLPDWQIDFVGDADAAQTWDTVFHIRPRYKANVLDAFFREWIEHFAFWCDREVASIEIAAEVIAALERYLHAVLQDGGGYADFLRKAMFEMLVQHCREGEDSERLVDWFVALVQARRDMAA